MNRLNKVAVACRFNILDLHDDALIALKICPPRSRGHSTRIDFELQDDATGAHKVLSFLGCANFRFIVDFDVLADNWPFNTKACTTKTNSRVIRKFVRAQMTHWRTTYMPPMPKTSQSEKSSNQFAATFCFESRFSGAPPTSWQRTTSSRVRLLGR